MPTNYNNCAPLGTLALGDTVTAPHGHYVLKLTNTGFILIFDGTPHTLFTSVSGVVSAKITAAALFIYGAGGVKLCTVPFSISAVKLCVDDDGTVAAYDVGGDPDVIASFTGSHAEVERVAVSVDALEELEVSLSAVQAKLRALKLSERPVSTKEAPLESGYPGPNEETGEKVA